jgi:probable addiction module antidote protein
MKPYIDHSEALIADLRKDPELALEYLKAALEDNSDDPDALRIALNHVARAYGIPTLAKAAKKPKQSVYRALSNKGNPTLDTVDAILRPLGMKLSIERRA